MFLYFNRFVSVVLTVIAVCVFVCVCVFPCIFLAMMKLSTSGTHSPREARPPPPPNTHPNTGHINNMPHWSLLCLPVSCFPMNVIFQSLSLSVCSHLYLPGSNLVHLSHSSFPLLPFAVPASVCEISCSAFAYLLLWGPNSHPPSNRVSILLTVTVLSVLHMLRVIINSHPDGPDNSLTADQTLF